MSVKKPRHGDRPADGVSRRGFLGSVSGTVAGVVIATAGPAIAEAPRETSGPVDVALSVNGRVHRLRIEPRLTLLEALRDELGLTGTKPGCGRGECGACTVLIDNVPRYACMTLAIEAQGVQITTVEGLLRGEDVGRVQRAFVDEDAMQCGYCTPGQVMAVEGLLRKTANPTLEQVREGISGNLCRCGTYAHICRAALRAAAEARQT